MKILFAASEVAPIVKVGGLGDVIGSLPKALAKFPDIKPAVIAPFYGNISRKKYNLKILRKNIPVFYDGKKELINLYQASLPDSSVSVFLIENKKYFGMADPYFIQRADGGRLIYHRFLFFSEAVFILLKNCIIKADIVHANDWHTGALVSLLKRNFQSPKTVFSIHNLASQAGYGERDLRIEGIVNADQVTTVSKTYVEEIKTKEFGCGLENFLKKTKLIGIINGVDQDILLKKFDKKTVKQKLQQELGLKKGANLPIFGTVTRLVEQKGIHLIVPIMEKFIEEYQAQFVFLGMGEKKYEEVLKSLARKYSGNISANILFSEELAQRIYIGSDFFLMPSLFEPCGLGQMIAMHYGTIPIARATGGLKDTIKDGKTGFLFLDKKAADLANAISRANKIFYNKNKLSIMRALCMRQDFSWKKSAKEYIKLYKKLV